MTLKKGSAIIFNAQTRNPGTETLNRRLKVAQPARQGNLGHFVCALFSLLFNLFFIDIVELYNRVIKQYKQSLQIEEKKANVNILTRRKHVKDPMINTLNNNMLMVSNLPTSDSIIKILANINLKFGEWT